MRQFEIRLAQQRVTGEIQRRRARTAVAEAELPVPDEVVDPTPRSKIRISNLVLAHNADKLHVGLIRKIFVHANFCTNRNPGTARNFETDVVDQNNEMRVAGGDSTPTTSTPSISLSVCGLNSVHPCPS